MTDNGGKNLEENFRQTILEREQGSDTERGWVR